MIVLGSTTINPTMADKDSFLSSLLDRFSRQSSNTNKNDNDDDYGEFVNTNYADSYFRRFGILSVFINRNDKSKLLNRSPTSVNRRRPDNFVGYRSRSSNRPRTTSTFFRDPFLNEEVEFVTKFSNI
ncbi:hypothetical protein DERP_007034 [Dermatophagoides pteronyssinus]|nr:hypothetical protein DERP_007034 [Dermatophagoides pteronyssinus]